MQTAVIYGAGGGVVAKSSARVTAEQRKVLLGLSCAIALAGKLGCYIHKQGGRR